MEIYRPFKVQTAITNKTKEMRRDLLLGVVETATSRHQRASRQLLVEGRVLATVELVDGNLPDGEGSSGTLAAVAGTFVRDPGRKYCIEFK